MQVTRPQQRKQRKKNNNGKGKGNDSSHASTADRGNASVEKSASSHTEHCNAKDDRTDDPTCHWCHNLILMPRCSISLANTAPNAGLVCIVAQVGTYCRDARPSGRCVPAATPTGRATICTTQHELTFLCRGCPPRLPRRVLQMRGNNSKMSSNKWQTWLATALQERPIDNRTHRRAIISPALRVMHHPT